mgnify:CR=1 FL=1
METNQNNEKTNDTRTRLSLLENNIAIVTHNVEKLETKIDSNYAVLHSRVSELRDDLRSDFELKNEKILMKLEEHNNNSVNQNALINEKISKIEKWKWSLMGGAAVIGYFIAHVRLDKLL